MQKAAAIIKYLPSRRFWFLFWRRRWCGIACIIHFIDKSKTTRIVKGNPVLTTAYHQITPHVLRKFSGKLKSLHQVTWCPGDRITWYRNGIWLVEWTECINKWFRWSQEFVWLDVWYPKNHVITWSKEFHDWSVEIHHPDCLNLGGTFLDEWMKRKLRAFKSAFFSFYF